jgi:glycosyltransferase involved in cell wall biosynthesis
MAPPLLTVIVPVYQEEGVIAGVLEDWTRVLAALGIDFRLRVYDDGSRDGTAGILDATARADARIEVVHQQNRGHGPTILRGYHEAASPWVFQVDGDGEMPAGAFARLWERREAFDLLVGDRRDRESAPVRRLVSASSRLLVRLAFGRGPRDVNTPYRLWRAEALRPLLAAVPADAFAPNVLLSGLAGRKHLRVFETPVPHHGRRSGRGSLDLRRLLAGVLRSAAQTLAVAWRAR